MKQKVRAVVASERSCGTVPQINGNTNVCFLSALRPLSKCPCLRGICFVFFYQPHHAHTRQFFFLVDDCLGHRSREEITHLKANISRRLRLPVCYESRSLKNTLTQEQRLLFFYLYSFGITDYCAVFNSTDGAGTSAMFRQLPTERKKREEISWTGFPA